MHIGFDVSQTGARKAGCGYFADAMIRALLERGPQHDYALYPSFGDFYFDRGMPRESPYPAPNARYGPRHETLEEARAFWTSPGLDARLGSPDVVHGNNFWCPQALERSRLVYTLHDLSFVANPAWTTQENRAGCWEGVSRAATEADWILAVSEASRRHYLEVFPAFPPGRIRVIPPCSRYTGSAEEGAGAKPPAGLVPGRYWLSVGTIEPRKNQKLVAEAYARYLALGGPPMPLVFAGGPGWLMDDFRRHLEALGIERHVVLTGYVSDEELAWLYRNCHANLYLSLFEGFGLPVLEGMKLGAPTIASDATSIPEVAGGAAILVKPDDAEALAMAMRDVAERPDERERLAREALAQAARFDWKASAEALLRLYEEAAGTPKRRKSA